MAYVSVSFSRHSSRYSFRKPLLYPSELRGHERGTVADCFTLRNPPLAL